MKRCQENHVEIPHNIIDSSKPLTLVAQNFHAMNAYGNHYRVKTAELSLTTCDSGIAAKYRRPWRSGLRDQNLVEAVVEYVGNLQNIVELDYTNHCIVIFVCEWVKANYAGSNATIRKDQIGFTIANLWKIVLCIAHPSATRFLLG